MRTYVFSLTHMATGTIIFIKRHTTDLDMFKQLVAEEGYSVRWSWGVKG